MSTVFQHQFDAEISNVLHLMIHSLYGDSKIFLRELISNASDALEKMRYIATRDSLSDTGVLEIHVQIDKDAQTLTISDNGIGMSKQELIENLGTIAKSGTKNFLKAVEQQNDSKTSIIAENQIGQFGVGFYSAFMVSDSVTVYSRRYDSQEAYVWQSNGIGGFDIQQSDVEMLHGTKIVLHLKDSASEYLDKYKIRSLITTYSNYIQFPIYLLSNEEGEEKDKVNAGSPLWKKSKSEISEQEYNEFYKYLDSSPYDPLDVIHIKAEGSIEYTALLYIPEQKPYDLFNPERRHRIKFYTRQVFITDEMSNILPSYLRFVRGIVNSDDLPLNISRESIQNDSTIFKIRKSLVKKIFSDLRTMKENSPDKFNIFCANYCEVLKEGLCDASQEEKDSILELVKFKSINHPENDITLVEYLNAMIDGQDIIFYATGLNEDAARANPQIEGFTARGIDVLLLTHYVDEFWTSVVHEYKNKALRSVLSSDIDLDKIKKLDNKSGDDEFKKGDEVSKDGNQEKSSDYSRLIEYFKKVLDKKIADARISKTITNKSGSPAGLSIREGGMGLGMEKMLIEQKQLLKRAPKILEINVNNPIIQEINKHISDTAFDSESQNAEKEREKAARLVNFVFDQSCIVQGEGIGNPLEFVKNINEIVVQAFQSLNTDV